MFHRSLLLCVAPLSVALACSDGGGKSSDHGGAGGSAPTAGAGGVIIVGQSGTGGGGGTPAVLVTTLPSGFTKAAGAKDGKDAATLRGGYQLIGLLADATEPSATSCANVLRVLVRDFNTYNHPDFGGPKDPQTAPGLVLPELAGRKPERSSSYPNVAVRLQDWYQNVSGTNTPYLMDLWLEPVGDSFVFDSTRFFPLDSVTTSETWQNDDDGTARNFGFTTELHTKFAYHGGEVFTFRGDDDVFVFIDGKLAVDLGGVHGPQTGNIALDTLGLTVGNVYDLDLFQAERNPTGSNFRIETTLDFTECGEILPDDIIIR